MRRREIFAGAVAVDRRCGITPGIFGATRVVNAGSVGMPFAEPGAYWLLLGPGVQLRRTPYDLAKAGERVRATAYPQAEDFAARNILEPPSESDMLNVFTRAGLH